MAITALDRDLAVGVDIGGTFTDVVVMDAAGEVEMTKAPTTPGQLELGVLDALERFAASRATSLDDLLTRVAVFGHGTTQATNTLIERTGARTGLLITQGFGDTLSIARLMGFTAGVPAERLGFYSRRRQPQPVVPRRLTREVPERVDSSGRVLLRLDEDETRAAVSGLLEDGVQAIAVCLLWSFRNPGHELRVRQIIEELDPRVFVSLSSDVAPVIGEYERAATTALNVYLGPRVAGYLERLEDELRRRGFDGTFAVLSSAGGIMTANDSARRPVTLLLSGPAGGVIGSQHLAELLEVRNVITTDMGGTSFDVGMVVDGHPVVSGVTEVGGFHVALPMIEVRAVGAGGGSIAEVVDGLLRVGPESAGAVPGPVCYGRGGDRVTVTDADVVLGLIEPSRFLGGRMPLDREAAAEAMRRQIAEPLGLSVEEAAAGVRRVVDSLMADTLREVTIGRGHDPRDFVLFAYGGAGPLHCASYGAELGVARIVVPAMGMVQSAYGALASDFLYTAEHSVLLHSRIDVADPADGFEPDGIEAEFRHLEVRCLEMLRRSGLDGHGVDIRRSADLRYRRQVHDLIVGVDGTVDRRAVHDLIKRFEAAYEDSYGKGAGFREAGIEITTLRVEAVARRTKPAPRRHRRHRGTVRHEARPVFDVRLASHRLVPVVEWDELEDGYEAEGPLIIEHASTTVFVETGQQMLLDPYGNIIVKLALQGGPS